MIRSLECPQNYPIYSIYTYLESTIFCNDSSNEQYNIIVMIKQVENEKQSELTETIPVQEKWWNLHFDGVVGKDGVWTGIFVSGLNHENHLCSYKLYFGCTNNLEEYESLILGIKSLKEIKVENVFRY